MKIRAFYPEHLIHNEDLRGFIAQSKHTTWTIRCSQNNQRNIIENNTIDLGAANFTDTFFEIAKQCMPAKTILVRQRDALWINDEIHDKWIHDKWWNDEIRILIENEK